MSDDDDMLFRRELHGTWKTPHIREEHPFPWRVRPQVSPAYPTAAGWRERSTEYLILDANNKLVAATNEPQSAHEIVATMNTANARSLPIEMLESK